MPGMRVACVLLAIAAAAIAAGCGGDAPTDEPAPSPPALKGAAAHAPAPATAAALTEIPNVAEARARLGYVNLPALDAAPIGRSAVLEAVLGTRRVGDAGSAVRVGTSATVLRGEGRVVRTGNGALAAELRTTRPQESAITPAAQSAAQSCLGETIAQTILGPGTMGADSALGVGLADGVDRPAGLQLRICGAPRYIRHIHAMQRTLGRRFGDLGTGARAPRIREVEIGEREIVSAVLPAERLPRAELVALLAAGPQLRALAWRR